MKKIEKEKKIDFLKDFKKINKKVREVKKSKSKDARSKMQDAR